MEPLSLFENTWRLTTAVNMIDFSYSSPRLRVKGHVLLQRFALQRSCIPYKPSLFQFKFDRYLSPHFNFYSRGMRLRAYQQFLTPYKTVSLCTATQTTQTQPVLIALGYLSIVTTHKALHTDGVFREYVSAYHAQANFVVLQAKL